MLASVENPRPDGPVRIGVGEIAHERALRAAGVEHFYLGTAFEEAWKKLGETAIRAGDTLVMVSPMVITAFQMQEFARHGVECQVVGHKPLLLNNEKKRQEFRRQKSIAKVPVKANKGGRPRVWPEPTSEHVAAIVALWHSPMKLAVVIERVRDIMDAKVPDFWVRDQVKKATGSAARKPKDKSAKEPK